VTYAMMTVCIISWMLYIIWSFDVPSGPKS
jgi:hypothetical protein